MLIIRVMVTTCEPGPGPLLSPHTHGSRRPEIIRFGDETQFFSFLYQYCVHFFPFRYCYLRRGEHEQQSVRRHAGIKPVIMLTSAD